MAAFESRHLAGELARIRIDDLHAVGARHVKPVRVRIEREVIPAPLTTRLPGCFQMVSGWTGRLLRVRMAGTANRACQDQRKTCGYAEFG